MKKWVEVNSFGDRSFFFGSDFSFSTLVQELELGTSVKNCISSVKQSFQSYRRHSKSEFHGLLFEVCHLNDVAHVRLIESYFGYSEMLWPPPPWFWSLDRIGVELMGLSINFLLR